MEQRKRALYRVVPEPGDRLELALLTSLGESPAERILDVSNRSVSALFPGRAGIELQLGQSVTLRFSSPALPRPVRRDAVVVSRVELESRRRYGFEFDEEGPLEEGVSAGAHRVFNRRGAYRVKPDPKEPVEVYIHVLEPEAPRHVATALLTSISTTGMDVVARPDAAACLAPISIVRLTLRLPTSTDMLEVGARIRHRTEEWNGVCYGLKLDSRHSADFHRQQKEILKYVSHRQAEAL